MFKIDEKILPKTESEYLLTLQNVMIMKNYQSYIRENLFEFNNKINLVKPTSIFSYVLGLYYNNKEIKNTIRLKKSYNLYLKKWENSTKIPITHSFKEKNTLDNLRKIGHILKTTDQRLN